MRAQFGEDQAMQAIELGELLYDGSRGGDDVGLARGVLLATFTLVQAQELEKHGFSHPLARELAAASARDLNESLLGGDVAPERPKEA